MRRELVKLGFKQTPNVQPNVISNNVEKALTNLRAKNSLLGYSTNTPVANSSSSLSNDRFVTSGEEYPALRKLYKIVKNKQLNFDLGKGNKLTFGRVGKAPFYVPRPEGQDNKTKMKNAFNKIVDMDDNNVYGIKWTKEF